MEQPELGVDTVEDVTVGASQPISSVSSSNDASRVGTSKREQKVSLW